jgi:hypothetical protein
MPRPDNGAVPFVLLWRDIPPILPRMSAVQKQRFVDGCITVAAGISAT